MKNLLVTIERNGKTNKLVMREDDYNFSIRIIGALTFLPLTGRWWIVKQVDRVVY